ncbi:Heavy metal transporter [Hyella patelloides LEGE 07179]|uniref:Heavy metal transporter n=1 Tax=Hyella patelloides LEGE 07179 TaxID=945734 RepID=A0A563VWC2_9CYAN|nr:heavy-metal-associated domain-containing protein [Hyella patelloides]VEP15716.1 Heavy metal transporter [Hyella patelloides LEGE 07179]
MKLEFTVPSMVCQGCVDSVKKAIANQDTNADISINLDTKKVAVETEVTATTIQQAIVEIGHTVE